MRREQNKLAKQFYRITKDAVLAVRIEERERICELIDDTFECYCDEGGCPIHEIIDFIRNLDDK